MRNLILVAALLSCGSAAVQCPGEGIVVEKTLELSGGRGRCDKYVLFGYTVGSETVDAEGLFTDLEAAGFACTLKQSGEECAPFVTVNCTGQSTEVQADWDYSEHTVNWSVIGGGLHTECWYE